ncbi:MAG TPA: hypothetical protein PKH77_01870 [Anaerolineae bacterium]|nr:hypothetical protein [Anaerolineae bacterium]
MTIEKFSEGAGLGSFSHVEKTHWQPAGRDSWQVPVIQQMVVSGTKGAFVFTCGAIASGLSTIITSNFFWPIMGASLGIGVAFAIYDFAENIDSRFETLRLQEISKEVYEKESQAAAGRFEERVILESYEKQGAAAVRATYDLLECSQEELAQIATLDGLSQRALQEAGIAPNRALKLLESLTSQNFIAYVAQNKPAVWTSKGLALVKYYRQNALEG